jgi:hypothetical protein
MSKYIRLLAVVILGYGGYFFLIPLINEIISFERHFVFLTKIVFWTDFFQFLIFLFCGIGLLKLSRIMRLIWLSYSVVVLFLNLPTFQMLLQGKFIKFEDAPFMYWVKFYGFIVLVVFSVIFLNLSRAKLIFRSNVTPSRDVPRSTTP